MYPGQDPNEPYNTPPEYTVLPPEPQYQQPPAYPPAGYSVPPLAPPTQRGTNVFGLLSMIFGIVSIPFIFCCYVGVPFAAAAIVLGIIGIVRANTELTQGRSASGKGMALAGTICGGAAIALLVILLVLDAGLSNLPIH